LTDKYDVVPFLWLRTDCVSWISYCVPIDNIANDNPVPIVQTVALFKGKPDVCLMLILCRQYSRPANLRFAGYYPATERKINVVHLNRPIHFEPRALFASAELQCRAEFSFNEFRFAPKLAVKSIAGRVFDRFASAFIKEPHSHNILQKWLSMTIPGQRQTDDKKGDTTTR
jgi:hypothetical protein